MWLWYELISFKSISELANLRKSVEDGTNPRDVKFMLGEELVERFYDKSAAVAARENFISRFQKGLMPDDMLEVTVKQVEAGVSIVQLIRLAGLTDSNSEAVRQLQQGAVKINGEKVVEKKLQIITKESIIIQVGKRRFAKIIFS
jgi:tyrosyl-tRNA synthetase